jgi:hypothetical protein
MRVVKHRSSDANAQKLMGDIARNLRRAAKPVEIALACAMDQVSRAAEAVHVENGKRFLQCLYRCAEHFLHDDFRRIFRL